MVTELLNIPPSEQCCGKRTLPQIRLPVSDIRCCPPCPFHMVKAVKKQKAVKKFQGVWWRKS